MEKHKVVRSYGVPNIISDEVNGSPYELTVDSTESVIDLAWTNGSTNEDAILIERSLDGIEFYGLNTVAAATESYTDTTVEVDTTYYYRVTALLKQSHSLPSNVASADTIQVPALVDAATTTDGSLVVLTFDIDMADPSDFAADFGLKVGGETVTITAVALGEDVKTIGIIPTTPFAWGDVITVTLISGNVAGADEGGLVETILNRPVINNFPAEVPELLTAATNTGGTLILLTFDITMADPATFLSDFTVKVGGTAVGIESVERGEGNLTFEITPTIGFVSTDVITITIASGNIAGVTEGGLLAGVTNMDVTNTVPA